MKIYSLIMMIMLFFGSPARATILWMGGEDIDFPNGTLLSIGTDSRVFRSGYSRGGVYVSSYPGIASSNAFPGGAVTSAWISFQWYHTGNSNYPAVGFGKTGTSSYLFFGTDSGNGAKAALWKYDGTTFTELASESGTSVSGSWSVSGPVKFDMQVISYGASATVNVYMAAQPTAILTYTGNVVAGSAVSLDTAAIRAHDNGENISEVIVSSTDTRNLSLVTLAPNAAGDTNNWTGSYSNINPLTINDATNITDNTNNDVFECKMNSLPSTGVTILGVKIGARATTAGGGETSIALGVKTNSSISVPSATTQTAAWSTTETFYSTNPVTTNPWAPSEINALQINMKTAP